MQSTSGGPTYEYGGYLATILEAPDPGVRDGLDHVVIDGAQLAEWHPRDLPSETEWQRVPVVVKESHHGVRLTGNFEDVRRIDILGVEDPCYWVPLSSMGWKSDVFPVDARRYPVVEVTYRCMTDGAQPYWGWTYDGGLHMDSLPRTRRWRTVAQQLQHFGFPGQIDALLLRLFSTTRTVETVEVSEVRFRVMSQAETQACERDYVRLDKEARPKHFGILDEFLPLGVVMDAGSARRLAEMLGVSLAEYWELAFEDIVKHHHNCVSLENTEQLTTPEWVELLRYAERFQIKVVPTLDFPIEADPDRVESALENRIRPYVDSSAVLAWSLRDEPRESEFRQLMSARALVESVDPNHPIAVVTQYPSGFPLYAPYLSVSGFSHFRSHTPWSVGAAVQRHAPLVGGQQFWMVSPAFIYATGTPAWSTCPEMRLMANLSFAAGARGWFTHAYHNDPIWISGSCQRTLTGPFLNFSDLWLELDQRMARFNALAPLLLEAEPAPLPHRWYVHGDLSMDRSELPEGFPATSSFRLRGPDYNLFFVVSNDTRGMSELNIDIPGHALRGVEVYLLSDFIHDRKWKQVDPHQHVEMFPGQCHVALVADKAVCRRWRDLLARRLAEDDLRQMEFNLQLARTYGLDVSAIEDRAAKARSLGPMKALAEADAARDALIDFVYATEAIACSRSAIIKASSAVCACDGALCRLVNRGKQDQAREMGLNVVPLAREVTKLRLELREGKGAALTGHCEDLVERLLKLLDTIRKAV